MNNNNVEETSGSFIVSTLEDEEDNDFSEGDLSLREAIALANESEGADTISFDNGLNGSIILTNGELTIEDALKIEGLGSDRLTIDANSQDRDRVFKIDDGNAETTIDVAIEGLTISGGELVPAQSNNSGGGILTRENLELSDSKISGNAAVISGGGIYSSGERLVINNSTIEDNSAFLPVAVSTSKGGGIATVGTTVEITDSVIADNSSSLGGGGINAIDSQVSIFNSSITDNFGLDAGGISAVNSIVNLETIEVTNNRTGIFEGSGAINLDSDSVLNLNHSVISDNFGEKRENPLPPGSQAFAAGIGNAGVANIQNTTISNNKGIGFGVRNSGELNVINSTFSGNDSAGIDSQDDTVNLSNSTIADNITGFSLDTDNSTATITSSILVNDSDEIAIDDRHNLRNFSNLLLGELQDNGGTTPTFALLEDSPAIDAGSNPNNLITDRRGEGFDRTVSNGTDIGAFEVQTVSSEDILGTEGRDFLQGTNNNDRLFGLDGRDFLQGLDGDDLIDGGSGGDRLLGGAGDDTITDGAGNGIVFGNEGDDVFIASNAGDDLFSGDAGKDTYFYDLNANADGFERTRIIDFEPEQDLIAFLPLVSDMATLAEFADLDTDGSGVLDSEDERINVRGISTTTDFSDLFRHDANTDTIALIEANNLDESNFLSMKL